MVRVRVLGGAAFRFAAMGAGLVDLAGFAGFAGFASDCFCFSAISLNLAEKEKGLRRIAPAENLVVCTDAIVPVTGTIIV